MAKQDGLTIAIIGLGNVGAAFAKMFSELENSKYEINVLVAGRDLDKTADKLIRLGIDAHARNADDAVHNADFSILTVKDSQIQDLCIELSHCFKTNSVVAHCSGILDSSVLISAKQEREALICSSHPLATFPTAWAAMARFSDKKHNTHLYYEGDEYANKFCNQLFTNYGFTCVELEADAKPLYHAACVFASNYLVSLIEISLKTAEAAGIEQKEFLKSIIPIVESTVSNIESDGLSDGLSGPIARGDIETVRKHLNALKPLDQSIKNTYKLLGERAIEVAKSQSKLSEHTTSELANLFKTN